MKNFQKVGWIIGSIFVAILLFMFFSGTPLFGPEDPSTIIVCGLGRESSAVDAFYPSLQEPSTSSTTQDPVPGNPPPYNNCLPDALAKMNYPTAPEGLPEGKSA